MVIVFLTKNKNTNIEAFIVIALNKTEFDDHMYQNMPHDAHVCLTSVNSLSLLFP